MKLITVVLAVVMFLLGCKTKSPAPKEQVSPQTPSRAFSSEDRPIPKLIPCPKGPRPLIVADPDPDLPHIYVDCNRDGLVDLVWQISKGQKTISGYRYSGNWVHM